MQISTKGQYGLKAMLDLAIYFSDTPISLSDIAKRHDLSLGYLEQVFSILRKGGLVKSIKGAQGGYIPTNSPDNIKVGDILRVLEGSLQIINKKDGEGAAESSMEYCLRTMVWERIEESVRKTVNSVTLGDLVAEKKRLDGSLADMYYI